jgi:hypothetical protein
MAESAFGGQFWFRATMHASGVNCRNATYKERLGTTPHEILYGKKKRRVTAPVLLMKGIYASEQGAEGPRTRRA